MTEDTITEDIKLRTTELLYKLKDLEPGTKKYLKIRNSIVELNLGLVKKVANIYYKTTDIPFDDLTQIGAIGLIKSVERYDLKVAAQSHKFHTFASYAVRWIRGEILHMLRDKKSLIRIPRSLHDMNSKISKARNELTKKGEQITNRQIADYLEVKLSLVEESILSNSNKFVVSLDQLIEEQQEKLNYNNNA